MAQETTDKFDADANEVEFDFEAARAELGEDLFGVTPEEGSPEEVEEVKEKTGKTGESADEAGKAEATPDSPEDPPAEGAEPPSDKVEESSGPTPAPDTWSKTAKEYWDGLPPPVQAEILKREKDVFQGIEQYRADAQLGGILKQIVTPHTQFFQRSGENPVQLLNNLAQAHVILSSAAPDRRRQLMLEVAKSYGVDLLSEPAYVDPTVANLQNELHSVKSQMQSRAEAEAAAERQRAKAELDAFIADPANVYVNDVLGEMGRLLEGRIASSLKDAYEQACRLNPVVHAKELTRLREEEANRLKKEAEAKVTAARQAASAHVRTKAKPASSATPVGTMDDTLQETLTSIRSRS